jgi:uncharacterized damage-inducible protein DinB
VTKAFFKIQLDYSEWATRKLLSAAKDLSLEQLRRDHGVAFKSIELTLQHIFYADRVWLNRLRGTPRPFADEGTGPDLLQLMEVWPAVWSGFDDYINGLEENELQQRFQYRNLAGDQLELFRWQALTHVVNHATLHRGQVMSLLRQSGIQPPATDIVFYYLQQPK